MTNRFKNILILTLLFCVCGSFFTRAWARTSSVNTADLWVASTYDAGDSVVWSAPNVTFKLHNNGTGGNIELYSDDHVLIQKAKTYRLEWRVANGYTINVTGVSVHVRSTLNDSYVTVGTNKSSNIGPSVGIGTYSTVNSQALTLGNTGYVTIYPESGYGDAIIHMDEITVTYTMDGVEKEVTFDGTDNWSTAEKYEPDTAFRVSATHVVFSLRKPMKQYNDYSWGKFKSHEYFFLDKDASSELRWWVDKGYSIEVSKIVLNASNGTSWGNRGKGYIHTSRMDLYDRLKVCESGTWAEVTFDKNGTNSNLYGATPSVLGNGEYFILSATTAEFDIKTITLTYSITPKTYTITLDSEGGSDGSENVILTFDSNLHEAITNPTKEGCTFEGWYTGDNGTGTLVIDADGELQANVTNYTGAGGIWKKDADDVTLYARWSSIPYSVRFNGNGSTGGSMDDQDFEYGTAQRLAENGFEKTSTVTYNANGGSCGIASSETDYDFLGWATSAGGDVEYADEEEVENLATTKDSVVNLYAKWATSPNSVELPTPTKGDSIFTGWYSAVEELVGMAGDSYIPSGNETLTAHWKPGVKLTISDLHEGDLVDTTEHAIFILHSDGYAITDYKDGYGFYVWKPLPISTTKDVTLSWKKTIADGDYSISVTNISFKAKAYNSNDFIVYKGKISFNGGDTISIGTATLSTDGGWSSTIGGAGDYASGVVIHLINTSGVAWETFDYHFKDFQIEYTITPNAPTPHDANLDATLSESAKQTLDVRVGSGALFTMSSPAADFAYTYRLKEDYANAHLEDGLFWATETGDYDIQARVASADDHEASAWSTSTVHVTRVCVFNDSIGNKDWQTARNWLHHAIPSGEGTDSLRVMSNLTIDEQVQVRGLYIGDAAKVEILPTGGLTVGAGGISGADAEKLILKSGTAGATKGQTGYLRIAPECANAMPQATVKFYSTAYYNTTLSGDGAATYQCVGAPVEGVQAKTVFTPGSYLYTWNEEQDGWVSSRTKLTFEAFKGFEVTQKKASAGLEFEYTGQLISVRDVKTINLDYTSAEKGYNLLANSWTAPIDIAQFASGDFINATQTIYILNAGTKDNSDSPGEGIDAPGKWIGMPINTVASLAESGYPRTIAPMQGFWIKTTGASPQLTLDYSRLVWGVDYSGTRANKPLRAPKRNTELDEEEMPITGKLQVSLSSETEKDFFFMLESERYDAAYEDGYDAMKIPSGSMDVFTVEGEDELGVDATNSIIGTRVGVRTGEETAYTLEFSHLSGENELALRDNETNEEIDINEGTQYMFFAEPNSVITERFTIVERQTLGTTTGVDKAENGAKVHKFIKGGQLYILKNGILYNAMGAIVR